MITEAQLQLFSALFAGRPDTYARRWEKDGKSGYSPAYDVDWDAFNAFKQSGGSFKNFPNKKLLPLTLGVLQAHLDGRQCVGVYPILPDNTSWFIAADFDGPAWLEDARKVMDEYSKVDLRSYLERSRSGNGGHVWIFFSDPYPCSKSRRIMLELVRRGLRLSAFDKEVSFDRLFPNQDFIEPEGFGNLIALPLQGTSARAGNTLFIDPQTASPYEDQWVFIASAHRHAPAELDAIEDRVFGTSPSLTIASENPSCITITLQNRIILSKSELSGELVSFLKERLNFINTEYLTRKRLGKSLYKVQKYFKLIDEADDRIFLPRGFLDILVRFLEEKHVAFQILDERSKYEQVKYENNIRLLPAQAVIVQECLQKENGVIVAPPGSGKTIIGLELIAQRKLPALILVHRKQLLDQWIDRIQMFLGIAKKDIGQYYSLKKQDGKNIAVAMLQTLSKMDNLQELSHRFGTVIVDECHHIPAATFRAVVSRLSPRYLYGLTATPERRHNDEQLIFLHIGEIIGRMEGTDSMSDEENEGSVGNAATTVLIRKTAITLPFKFTTDNYQLLAKIICFDTERNQRIVEDIVEQVGKNKKILLLSERRDHLEVLRLYLKGVCETIVISGEDSAVKRASKLKQIKAGHYQIILSTGQFFGEGLDIDGMDCLILAFPFSFEGKLVQYIGRLRSNGQEKTIIDYRDADIPFLERQFKKRLRYYGKIPNGVIENPMAPEG